VELPFLAKAGADEVENSLFWHFRCDVEVVGVREASQLISVELFELFLSFNFSSADPALIESGELNL
jgi:hypothetical protein